MTAPDPIEQLQRRVAGLEAEQFAQTEQLRRLRDATEHHAETLDELEAALDEIATSAALSTDAMAAAITQRQAHLDAEPTPSAPPPGPTNNPNGPTSLTNSPDGPVGGSRPDLAVLHAWVEAHLAPMVRKTTTTGEGGGIRWCRHWWQHSDAVERFTALHRAFGQLSAEESATWLSVYLRDHLDPHLATLTSPYGPFYACTPRKHSTALEQLGQAELDTSSIPGGQHDHGGEAHP